MKEKSKNANTSMLYDAHTHRKATHGGVSILNIDLWETPPQRYFSAGIHPWWMDEHNPDWVKALNWMKALVHNKDMLAIGECGLDLLKNKNASLQLMWFREHLALASEHVLPVLLHLVKSDHLALPVIDQFNDVSFIYHGFSGKWSRAESFVKRNIVLSFGASLLNNEATRDSFCRTPDHLVLLESDHAQHLRMDTLYQVAAQLRGLSIEEFCHLIKHNFTQTFTRYGQKLA